MKELVKHRYKLEIYPEHPHALDYDRDRGRIGGYPGGGGTRPTRSRWDIPAPCCRRR